MFFNSYQRLPQRSSDFDDKNSQCSDERHRSTSYRWKIVCVLLSLCLAVSLIFNTYWIHYRYLLPQTLYNEIPSKYAHLSHDTLKRTDPSQDYASLNRTIQDAAWNDKRLNSWGLFVALDDQYVASEGLPRSMRWPWDSKKGVYILMAAHELHCVNVLRSWVNEKQDGVPEAEMEWGYEHALNCLNVLRESVICHADDLPLYTGRVNENVHFKKARAGRGMTRMCRNWDALVSWADERSACYLSTQRKNTSFSEIERYKYCPDGARPWEGRTDLH